MLWFAAKDNSIFKSTFQNSDISLPEIADKIQKIEIITEDVKNFMMDKRDINEYNIKQNSSNKQNSNNLAQIHSAFQIHGDITDKDLENINSLELKELKNKFTKERLEYEYNRFLQHSHEND